MMIDQVVSAVIGVLPITVVPSESYNVTAVFAPFVPLMVGVESRV